MSAIASASALASRKTWMSWLPVLEASRSRIMLSMSCIASRGARTMMVLVRASGVRLIDSRTAVETSVWMSDSSPSMSLR